MKYKKTVSGKFYGVGGVAEVDLIRTYMHL